MFERGDVLLDWHAEDELDKDHIEIDINDPRVQ